MICESASSIRAMHAGIFNPTGAATAVPEVNPKMKTQNSDLRVPNVTKAKHLR